MENKAQNRIILFANNIQITNIEFNRQNILTRQLAALLYAQADKIIDCEAIRQCHNMIIQNTTRFSDFRKNMTLCISTLLALSPNPQEMLDKTLEVYNMLIYVGLHFSDFLVIAAYHIASQADPSEYDNVVNRTRYFYDKMNFSHSFYTGEDDYIFAAMLGLTDLNFSSVSERMETIYNRFKGEFCNKNSIQTLAQVLVLGNSDDNAEGRVLALRDAFKKQKIRLDKACTLSSLGILALLPADIEKIVRDIREVQIVLQVQDEFWSTSVTTQEILLFVAYILASEYSQELKGGILTATILTSINNIIIAQKAYALAAIPGSAVTTKVLSIVKYIKGILG